jgi:hypothetical protein
MNISSLDPQLHHETLNASIQRQIASITDELIQQLPNPSHLTAEQRRGIIARYSSVLEGNFIYWMTAAYIAVKSEEVRPILAENLSEEIRDAHPVMLRKFTIAARAFPSEADALSVHRELTSVRLFLGKLRGVQSVLTMAFFEGWIQRFMGFLADLARAQGSLEREYTDVHGVCDISHTAELFRALQLEMAANPISPDADLFEGVDLLRKLIIVIVHEPTANAAA